MAQYDSQKIREGEMAPDEQPGGSRTGLQAGSS